MIPQSKKIVWDGMTYRQLAEVWNTHHCAWSEDKQDPKKLQLKQHYDRIMDFVEKQHNIEITLDDCVKIKEEA